MSRTPYSRPRLEALEARAVPSTCTVDRLTDNNPTGGGEGGNGMGDLRWCVIDSQYQDDVINFSVTGTINLAAGLPSLNRNVSIDGPGAGLLTVRRNTGGDYNIFAVGSGTTASISGLTVANGYAHGFGGGIYNSGILTVSNSTVSGNLCSGSGDSFGGGIYNAGALTISDSTISGNTVIAPYGSGSHAGGIYNAGGLTVIGSTIASNLVNNSGGAGNYGGGIDNSGGVTTVENSTISGNSFTGGDGYGGGIVNGSGVLYISHSTISNNYIPPLGGGGQGGGIANNRAMTVLDTIISGNTARTGPDVRGALGSQGHNLIGNPQDMTGSVSSDLLHVNPMLGPLTDNGGLTQTMALLRGSPAIDAGDNAGAPMWDQRGPGFRRIVNGTIDIGAFEVQARGHNPPSLQPLPNPVPAQPTNLIVNGDFEQGDVGFTSDYESGGQHPGSYEVVSDPRDFDPYLTSFGDHTTGSGLMMVADGATVPDQVVWSETVRVDPGTNYDFAAWVATTYPLSPAVLDFRFNGQSVGVFTAPSEAGVWAEFATTWNSGSSTSVTIQIIDTNTQFSGNCFALDDLSLMASNPSRLQVAAPPGLATGLDLSSGRGAGVVGQAAGRRDGPASVGSGTPTSPEAVTPIGVPLAEAPASYSALLVGEGRMPDSLGPLGSVDEMWGWS